MTKNKIRIFIFSATILAAGLIMGLAIHKKSRSPKDYMEYFGIGYSDLISMIIEGYRTDWKNFSPEDIGLGEIYKQESAHIGFVQYDMDGDGVEELLIGEQSDNGEYRIYDIFTFDRTTGDVKHILGNGMPLNFDKFVNYLKPDSKN